MPRPQFYIGQACRSGRFLYSAVCRRHYATANGYSATSHSVSSQDEIKAASQYCSNLLRQYDAPAHTLLAFVPKRAQTAYLAIRAFNLEIARIADTASTPQVAALRLQFWRDTVSRALEGSPPKQPVAVLIAQAAEELSRVSDSQARFTRSWFHRIISAREQQLENRPYASLDALERYAENTYSTLLYLTLQALPMNSVTADHIASHIGKASGIAAILRGVPLLAFPPPPNHHSNNAGLGGDVALNRTRSQQGSVTLPLDVMAEVGLREEDVFREGASAKGLSDAVFKVATRANDHLITARTMMQNLKKGQDEGHEFEHQDEEEHQYTATEKASQSASEKTAELDAAFGILMPAVPTQLWLDRLQKVDFNVFDDSLRKRDWTLPWKTYMAYRRRAF